MAEADADGASAAAVAGSGADGSGESPAVEGGGAGALSEEKEAAAKGAEAAGDSEEDGEDVFEVEKILDMKTEGGKILYKVRWKGYTSDDDTWEPEVHLEDCKEVLLEFRKKVAENKAKPVKKDIQRLTLNNDIFEANSDSDQQSETQEDTSPKKKKKKLRPREEKSPEDLKKKKAKSGKAKDKPKADLESSSESSVFDLRTKKRILEAREELKESKKPKKDDVRESKELRKGKKGEVRDLKTNIREDSKEEKKAKKEKCVAPPLEPESTALGGSSFQEADSEDSQPEHREEKQTKEARDKAAPDALPEAGFEQQQDGALSADEEDARAKRKKKRPRKTEEPKESRTPENKSPLSEKKPVQKKQRNQDRGRSGAEAEKLAPASPPAQSGSRPGADSPEEEKETQKNEPKEKYQKRQDLDKDEKGRREPKALKPFKEIRNAFDLFKLTPEEKNDSPENSRKREEIPPDCQVTEDQKSKENKQALKGRRGARDEADTWAFIAAEGDQEALDSVCPADENPDASGMTLVMLAAAGGQDDLLRLLLRKGAKVNGRQKNGTTALIHAAEKNFLTTVAILLEAGAFVNVQQSNGETALMKACKRGNSDIVRLVIERGADCNVLSKHQNSALHFAKQSNNVLVYDLLRSHLETLSRVAEETIKDYFEARLALLEPVFPIACHRLCEGPDFSTDFHYRPPQNIPEGSGILLFIFHANFLGKEVIARLCGPCSVQAVVLNDKFQLPVFLDSHFVYSFSPAAGLNKLFIRLTEAPSAKVKLLIGAYRVQLQ
uniref:Chromo domain-containing protein n=1 Tax=Sus scrofa TaxID=9823 RepID=A0A8D1V860_PIG